MKLTSSDGKLSTSCPPPLVWSPTKDGQLQRGEQPPFAAYLNSTVSKNRELEFYDLLAGLPLEDRITVFNSIVEGDVVDNLHERIEIVRRLGDERTAHLMDWICADESLHMLNGMRWLRYLHGKDDLAVDQVLDRGQRLLMEVLGKMKSSEKSYDSAAELSDEEKRKIEEKKRAVTFYHERKAPVAPIARELGGFSREQIEKLIQSAAGKVIRL